VKKLLKKLDSKWGVTLAICLTIVVSSVATATAGSIINGKNIKKGTVTSKQIKNGTIVKSDLSKKLSVTGPQGPQGLQGVPGAAGATSVSKYVWHSEDVGDNIFEDRDIQCGAGEKLVGGGAGWEKDAGAKEYDSILAFSGPVDSSGDPASDGSSATGWGGAGQNTAGAVRDFEVFALCAKP
jgi:hypothetical protein